MRLEEKDLEKLKNVAPTAEPIDKWFAIVDNEMPDMFYHVDWFSILDNDTSEVVMHTIGKYSVKEDEFEAADIIVEEYIEDVVFLADSVDELKKEVNKFIETKKQNQAKPMLMLKQLCKMACEENVYKCFTSEDMDKVLKEDENVREVVERFAYILKEQEKGSNSLNWCDMYKAATGAISNLKHRELLIEAKDMPDCVISMDSIVSTSFHGHGNDAYCKIRTTDGAEYKQYRNAFPLRYQRMKCLFG